MKFEFRENPPGIHPPTAALTRILNDKQVTNPVTETSYSEAMLLGIGGGLDIGYILFQLPHLPHPMLVLGFRNQWNHNRSFLNDITTRLSLRVSFQEFEDKTLAEKALQSALSDENIAIVWVDKAFLPHHQLPEYLKGYINHQVAVYHRNGRLWRLYLDDLSTKPIEIREKLFTDARANLSQNNYLMMIFHSAGEITAQDLREGVIDGIKDCVTQLLQPLKTVGISNLETWSENLIDKHDQQGWPQIFKDPQGLFPVLQTIYESIKLNGTDGFALRKMYARFLHEAADILKNSELNAVAGQYLQLSNHWSSLADNALPSRIPEFDRVKNLLNKKYDAYRQSDHKTCKKSAKDLQTISTKISADFPLDESETYQLFNKLSNQVKLIAELELSAAYRLRDILRR